MARSDSREVQFECAVCGARFKPSVTVGPSWSLRVGGDGTHLGTPSRGSPMPTVLLSTYN